MPGRINELSETQIIADILADKRRLAAAVASVQIPQPAKDTLTITTNGQPATWQLSAIPYQGSDGSSLNLSWNGQEIVEGVDYTVDYTTAIVTFSSAQQALFRVTPAPADLLTADYWTTGDLIAATGPADTGSIADNFNRADSPTLGTMSDGVHSWTEVGTAPFTVVSNQATNTDTSAYALATVDSAVADGTIQATIGGTMAGGLAFRVQDINNMYTMRASGLWKIWGGATYEILAFTVTAGDVVRIEYAGADFNVYVNGVAVNGLSPMASDAQFPTGTTVGLYAENTITVDDFTWTA